MDASTMAIVTWAKDGRGKKWKEMGEYMSKVPPINGRKGARTGWIFEWKITYSKDRGRYLTKKCENGRLPK
jgi:hypothetical protein